jgi:hypothetical protein
MVTINTTPPRARSQDWQKVTACLVAVATPKRCGLAVLVEASSSLFRRVGSGKGSSQNATRTPPRAVPMRLWSDIAIPSTAPNSATFLAV